jgi:hypothetical protein
MIDAETRYTMSKTSRPAIYAPEPGTGRTRMQLDTSEDQDDDTFAYGSMGPHFVKIFDKESKKLHQIPVHSTEEKDILTAVLKAASKWGNEDEVFSEPDGRLLRVQLFTGRISSGYSAVGHHFVWRVVASRTWAYSAHMLPHTPEDGSCAHKGKGGPCLLNEHVPQTRWCLNCQRSASKLRGIPTSDLQED